ncbi:flavoprotein [Actinocorallia herbida]|uniref:Flavoprotein n=1 Tax=Actinocorallia herbida TaxID=58109 RepID=A0A3N1CSB3_9ACTN|nr:flavoprotein [Actinocorallia herbida]ROO84064.1 flavoprotein [Actinocorallia herbida]
MSDRRGVLYVIVCAAGSAARLPELLTEARGRGWDVCVVATPAAEEFLDVPVIEEITGRPVFSRYRRPDEPRRLPDPDAVVVAPATYNTINKWAQGIADNYALGLLAEWVPTGIPAGVLPFVNTRLAANPVFESSLAYLRAMGVRVIYGPGEFEPDPPRGPWAEPPWPLVLDAVERDRR